MFNLATNNIYIYITIQIKTDFAHISQVLWTFMDVQSIVTSRGGSEGVPGSPMDPPGTPLYLAPPGIWQWHPLAPPCNSSMVPTIIVFFFEGYNGYTIGILAIYYWQHIDDNSHFLNQDENKLWKKTPQSKRFTS